MILRSFLFERDITIIRPESKKQAEELMLELSRNGIRWNGGRSLLDEMHLHTRNREFAYLLQKSSEGVYSLTRGYYWGYLEDMKKYKRYPSGSIYSYTNVVVGSFIYSVI